jgi:integrase
LATFTSFLDFIREVGRDVDTAREIDLLSFLQQYVDKQRAASTIRSAHAALLHFFTLYGRHEFSTSPLINLLVRGAQNLAPVKEKVPFIWDPEIPLNMLAARPYPDNLREAGREAALLLLLATGIRVSDASRLSRKMVKTGAVWAIPYLEKRKTGPSPPQTVLPYPTARLCPVRALQRFLSLANPFRKPNERFLFISMLGKRASVDTLRNWVRELLKEAGIQAPAGSCRSAATSAAISRNVDIDLVMKAAGWAKESTFRRYYQRAIHPGLFCESLLPPAE